MDILKFTLKGEFAFFKKPDVNSYFYFTYGNIHKVALLGMLGATLGYGGYSQSYNSYIKDKFDYPMFYEKLKDIKIAIVPNKVNISKKIQVFNNSVGYASKEQGGNLIIKEQWLENPSWDIYIKLDNEESQKIAKAFLERRFKYIPYLGKNDHLADITEILLIKECKAVENIDRVHSLYLKDDFKIIVDEDDFDEEGKDKQLIFKYQEKLPIALEKETNKYKFKSFIFTNNNVIKNLDVQVFRVNNKNIVFF